MGKHLSELTGTAFQSGQSTAQGLIDGLASKEPALYQKAQEMMNQISGILNNAQSGTETDVDGSHAMGLSYVPWDGYIAQLHQGKGYSQRSRPGRWTPFPPARYGSLRRHGGGPAHDHSLCNQMPWGRWEHPAVGDISLSFAWTLMERNFIERPLRTSGQ